MHEETVSISNGDTAIRHNCRKTIAPNVDPNRSHLNVVYKQEDLHAVYDRAFGKALEEYNNKHSEDGKAIPDYIQKISQSKNKQKTFYELVVQVGNRFTCGVGLSGEEIAVKILDEYAKDFEKRNPHIAVINMVMHRDEPEGTPHIHIDYVPVADGYKRGLKTRNSLYMALEQQGIPGDKSKNNSKTSNWYRSEKAAIARIMEKYGWEPEIDSELHLRHKSVETYKTIIQIVKNEVSVLPEQIKKEKHPFSREKVIVRAEDLEKLEERAKLSIINSKAINELTKSLKEKEKVLYDYATYAQIGVETLRRRELEERERRKKLSQIQEAQRNSENNKEGAPGDKGLFRMEDVEKLIREERERERERGYQNPNPEKINKKEQERER